MILSRTPFPRWLTVVVLGPLLALVPSSASAETLTAEQAVARAAKDNPSLRAALLDVSAAKYGVDAEEGARDPTFVASVQGQYNESLNAGSTTVSRGDSEALSGSAAVKYTTDIGTDLEVGVESDINWRNGLGTGGTTGSTVTGSVGPVYGTSAYVSARQPLLRGAGTDAQLASIELARDSQTSAEKSRDSAASQNALDVLTAYWELWYAKRATKVQEDALAVAKKQLDDAKIKAEQIGTGSRFDVLSFAQSAASIQDSLSQARATERTRAIALGQLLGMPPEQALGLEPAGDPPDLSGSIPADKLKAAFLERSPELAALRSDIEAAETRVASAKNADKPKLDAFATVSMGLLWQNDDLPGLSLPGSRPAFSVLGGLDLELPLGDGRTTGDLARARAQLEAAKARYQAKVDAIAADVGSLQVGLDAANDQVALSAESAKISQDLADAERQRFLIGTNASTDVVKAEQTAREAQLRQLRAVVDRVTNRFQLENAAGTLLDRFGGVVGGKSS
jgi:outer membrane protein TolC